MMCKKLLGALLALALALCAVNAVRIRKGSE